MKRSGRRRASADDGVSSSFSALGGRTVMAGKAVNLKSVSVPSVRERVSAEEWEIRCDLAAAYQLAALFKWTDLIYTHFSARVPGSEDLLINAYGLLFDEIT